jgi:hypothetical protein
MAKRLDPAEKARREQEKADRKKAREEKRAARQAEREAKAAARRAPRHRPLRCDQAGIP